MIEILEFWETPVSDDKRYVARAPGEFTRCNDQLTPIVVFSPQKRDQTGWGNAVGYPDISLFKTKAASPEWALYTTRWLGNYLQINYHIHQWDISEHFPDISEVKDKLREYVSNLTPSGSYKSYPSLTDEEYADMEELYYAKYYRAGLLAAHTTPIVKRCMVSAP